MVEKNPITVNDECVHIAAVTSILPVSKLSALGMTVIALHVCTGLPDFSWYNIPKWQKYSQCPQNIPNAHKIYQMATKYTTWK
jgi:hypothetical protein